MTAVYHHRPLSAPPARAALLRMVALGTSRNHGVRDYPRHRHDDHELVLVLGSGYRCRIAGQAVALAAGDALLVVPGDEHADGGGSTAAWLTLRFRVWASAPRRQEVALVRPGTAVADRVWSGLANELEPLVSAIEGLGAHPDAGSALAADALAGAVVWRLASRMAPAVRHPLVAGILADADLDARIAGAVAAAGFTRIEVPELARRLDMSASHLAHACARAHGRGPAAIALDARLAEARRLLAAGVAPGEVAHAVGFSDPAHFTRAYRRAHGHPPSAEAVAPGVGGAAVSGQVPAATGKARRAPRRTMGA